MTNANTLTDKEYYQLTISIGKALNSYEMPIKSKHVRAAIIGTYHSNGGHAFWAIAIRQPLQENRITAWKFCHVLHKILREGHPLTIQHSMRHRGMMTELGKLWGHLNDGYGLCIKQYTKLLVTKLNFHDRNGRFPGNLVLKRGELEQIAGGDINVYFQLAVEIFDYLDDIVALQATIFNSITTFSVSSMTSAGQCRLAPLIPCIQDSNQLYDFVVRLMFLLHANLPEDLLTGHRERFRTLFRQLNSFYKQSGQLQYFINLITVPTLPKNPPNFLVQSDLGNYTAPVVLIPQESQDDSNSIVENLVDTSAPPVREKEPEPEPVQPVPPPLPTIDFDRLLKERDEIILRLRHETERQQEYNRRIVNEKHETENKLQEQLAKVSSDLSELQHEASNLRIEKEELELKLQSAPNLEQKALAEEEKAKSSEEKFQKLKNMYTQIRDEHIKLLRQHGETKKELAESSKVASEASKQKEELQMKLQDVEMERTKINETLQQSSSDISREKDEYTRKISELEREKLSLLDQYQDVESNKSAEIAELKISVENLKKSLEELKDSSAKISEEKANLENEYQEVLTKKGELEQLYQNQVQSMSDEKLHIEEKINSQVSENESLKKELEEKDEKISTLETKINEVTEVAEGSQQECERLKEEMQKNEQLHTLNNANYERMLREKGVLEMDVHDLLYQQEEIETRTSEMTAKHSEELSQVKIKYDTAMRALLETCIKTSEEITERSIQENETLEFNQINSTHFILASEEFQDVLSKLKAVHEEYLHDNEANSQAFVKNIINCGHILSIVHERGILLCNKSANINSGEKIAEEIKEFGQASIQLLQSLHDPGKSDQVDAIIDTIKDKLYKITNMIGDITNSNDEIDRLGDLVEEELNGMDKAIAEAAQKIAEMLKQSRESDSGIKLEVNEKILDSCTSLMHCIQILVKKSRKVQAEIVALGKGTSTAKEFYKRNHQWTEGLISAAKSVAQGATFLVSAANKAVSGDSKHTLDIVAAAQEIAACVATLVVASKVKAPKESTNLRELVLASKDVTQSTGTVVATAKDCSQQLEETQDLDFTKLTVHQAKTKEMEVQVKVLELEQALQMERMRLAALRRQNYQNQNND